VRDLEDCQNSLITNFVIKEDTQDDVFGENINFKQITH
jgi:hypothetical protein